MADKEKVIKGLEMCMPKAYSGMQCDECPYKKISYAERRECDCVRELHKDAIALLKEQEPMVPVYDQLLTQVIPRCGKRGYRLVKGNDKYCCRCGQAVKWK